MRAVSPVRIATVDIWVSPDINMARHSSILNSQLSPLCLTTSTQSDLRNALMLQFSHLRKTHRQSDPNLHELLISDLALFSLSNLSSRVKSLKSLSSFSAQISIPVSGQVGSIGAVTHCRFYTVPTNFNTKGKLS